MVAVDAAESRERYKDVRSGSVEHGTGVRRHHETAGGSVRSEDNSISISSRNPKFSQMIFGRSRASAVITILNL